MAEGWRELPRVRLGGPLRRGPVLVRPVGELMPGPVRFHAKRFCRTADLQDLMGKFAMSREFSVGNGRPSAAWRRPWQRRGSHWRPASPPGGAPQRMPHGSTSGAGSTPGHDKTPTRDVLARGERDAGADQLLPPDPPDVSDLPAPLGPPRRGPRRTKFRKPPIQADAVNRKCVLNRRWSRVDVCLVCGGRGPGRSGCGG